MKKTVLRLETFLPYRLSILTNTISRSLSRHYARRFRLSIAEWRVMAVLGMHPGLSAAEVAERTAMDKVKVSRAVSKLIQAGRLRRQVAENDRRRSILKLSAAGTRVYREVVPLARRIEKDLLTVLDQRERAELDRLLTKLHRHATDLSQTES